MQRRRRTPLLALAAVVLAALIAACGSSSHSSTSPKSTSAPATSSSTSAKSTTSPATSSSTSSSTTSSGASAAAGKSVFTSSCGTCHVLGAAGTHGTVGPDLDKLKPSTACVVAQVTGGGAVHTSAGCKPYPGSLMPSFAHTLSSAQIQSVAKYVSSVAGKVKGGSGGSSGLP